MDVVHFRLIHAGKYQHRGDVPRGQPFFQQFRLFDRKGHILRQQQLFSLLYPEISAGRNRKQLKLAEKSLDAVAENVFLEVVLSDEDIQGAVVQPACQRVSPERFRLIALEVGDRIDHQHA